MGWKPVEWKYQWAWIDMPFGRMLMYEPLNWVKQFATLKGNREKWSQAAKLIMKGSYKYFFDAGAAYGVYTILAANYCSHVVAYEASPLRFFCLATNLARFSNVDVRYQYVSCKGDQPKWGENFDMIKNEVHTKWYNIPVVTFDEEVHDTLKGRVTEDSIFMKIDVEGNELKVLEGAKTLVDLPNIHWFVETHPRWGGDTEKCKSYFQAERIHDINARDFLVL
jgi:FkbM family methyltransferase